MTIEIDIAHRAGDFTLDVSFRSAGRLTALFGRSGSGKTTVVNAIAGLIRPERGRIVVDGRILADTGSGVFVPKHRRRIGYVFQEARLFPHLTVRQNLVFGRWFNGRPEASSPSLETVAELLDIGTLLARRPDGLSGGEKQRVAVGRALLSRPRLLLMDEPLASLDDARKAEILPYIERMRDEAGVPIVYVSHSVGEVARLATTIVVMERGRVVTVGPVAETFGGRLGSGPLARDRETGALIEGIVSSHDEPNHLTSLETPAGIILVPRLDAPAGRRVRILVAARDVMLSTIRPERISALNVLEGEVAEVGEPDGAWLEVRLRCGGAHLLSRVTRKSAKDLAVAPGRRIYAMVKSVTFEADRVGTLVTAAAAD
jgi:molybdate transport system ATP-binding protein